MGAATNLRSNRRVHSKPTSPNAAGAATGTGRREEAPRLPLTGGAPGASLERTARLIARTLGVPLGGVSLRDDSGAATQVAVHAAGAASAGESRVRALLAEPSLWPAQEIVAPDASAHPLLGSYGGGDDPSPGACLGVPILQADGSVIGTLLAADVAPRDWGEEQLEILRDLAASLAAEVELVRDRAVLRSSSDGWTHAALEEITDIVCLVDREWRLSYVNAQAESYFGRSRAELVGRSIWEAVPLSSLDPDVRERIGRAMEDGAPVEFETASCLEANRWYRFRLIPMEAGMAVYAQSITGRRRAEAALREAERTLEAVVKAAPAAIILVDVELTVQIWNPTAEAMFGWKAEEVIGRPLPLLTSPSAEEIRTLAGRVLAGETISNLEVNRFRKDGVPVTLSLSLAPMWDEHGQVTGIVSALNDITESRRATAALRASEDRFRQVVESVDQVFWLADLGEDGGSSIRHLYVSPAALKVFGHAPEELETDPQVTFAMVLPEHRPAVLSAWRTTRAGEPASVEYEIELPRGERRWVLSRMSPVRDEHGRIYRVAGVTADITSRRHMEIALRRSHNLVHSILEGTSDPIYVKDVHGRYLLCNSAAAAVMRLPAEEVIGKDDWEIYPPELAHRLRTMDHQVITSGEPFTVQLCIDTDAGTRTFLDAKAPHRDHHGQVIGLIGIARDITSYKREEDALKLRERQLADAQRLAYLGSWEMDVATGEVTWSDELYTIFGLEPQSERCTYESYLARVHPGDRERVRDIVENALRTGAPFEFEERIIRPDGSERVLLSRGATARDDTGRVVRMIGTCQDVTAHREAERSLRQAIAHAERASEAKSDFMSRMSHELRTPLNAILGFGQLMEADPDLEDRESIGYILRAGKHLLHLIDEMLDLSKIEAGKISLTLEPTSVREMVQQSCDLIRPAAEEHGISMRTTGLQGDRFVLADAQRLKQVLLNLLSNAVKYNRQGGSVVIHCAPTEGARVRIEVQDTGIGLDPDQIGRLFIPFERVGAERTQTEGTGLGLALSKGLVEAMGGKFGVESVNGEGSTFWFELPVAAGTPSEVAEAEEQLPEEATAAPSGRRVLYIEDNLLNLRLVERLLGRRGDLELIHAMQGGLGLELARQHRPDLILLDVQLPDINGDEVLWRLQQDPELRLIPVVAVSADATPRQVQRLLDLGAREYLTKPLDVRKFLATVDELLPVEA